MDRPLSREDLEQYRYSLARLSLLHVYAEYRRLHEECGLNGERLPKARSIQQLVTVWRYLRAQRKGQRLH
jgi:hypothetical protein